MRDLSRVIANHAMNRALGTELERAIGFEPMMNGSAVRRLGPLGYAREFFGEPIASGSPSGV